MTQVTNLIVSKMDDFGSLTFDADGFSNASYYRNSYNIPSEERLLVYADAGRLFGTLEGSGTFITDEAIYIHPAKKSWSNISRIPLKDICHYLIYPGAKNEVKLLGERSELMIFVANSRESKSAANELLLLLKSLQDSMCRYNEGRREYERTITRIYSVIRRELKERGVLSDSFIRVLSVMEESPFFAKEAVLLLLENEYRRCDKAAFDVILENKKRVLPEETFRLLSNPHDLFFTNLAADLSDPDSFSDLKSILDAYLRFRAQKKLNIREAEILCYLCIRMEDYEYMEAILHECGDDFEEERLWALLAAAAKAKNRRIHKLQARIATMGDVTSEELLYTNDLGLCSLHYSLMLRNKDIIRYVLPLCDWMRYKSPFPKDRIADTLFEPMFVACLMFRDETLLREVFIHTSPRATALNRSIKGLDAMVDINTSLKRKYPEHREEYAEKIEEYKSLRREMKEELKNLAKAEVRRCRKMARIIKDAKHPLGEYMLGLYESPATLLSWINCTAGDIRLNKYKTAFFATAPGKDEGFSFYEWEMGRVTESKVSDSDRGYRGRTPHDNIWEYRTNPMYDNPSFREALEAERRAAEERERRRREFRERIETPAPHAGSWFSEAARSNIRTLKEEYRILVKKYHPDSSGDERTSRILMRIMNERADILDSMGRS